MKKLIPFLSFVIATSSAFAQEDCLQYVAPRSLYEDTLLNDIFVANLNAEKEAWRFFDFLRASGIDPAQMSGIDPRPLKITNDGVLLLGLVIDENDIPSCFTISVPMRKVCNKVGLEYYGKAVRNEGPPSESLLREDQKAFCYPEPLLY